VYFYACLLTFFLINLTSMPLQEILSNKIAISRTQSLPDGLKGPSRGAPKGYTRNTNGKDTPTLQTT